MEGTQQAVGTLISERSVPDIWSDYFDECALDRAMYMYDFDQSCSKPYCQTKVGTYL